MTASFFEESDDIQFGENAKTPDTDFSASRQSNTKKTVPLAKQDLTFSAIQNPETSLRELLKNMKPSFLIAEDNKEIVRQICISAPANFTNPSFLIKKENTTILLGTGFSEIEISGKTYPSFPDMRLPFSEKDSIQAWIILEEIINIELLEITLPVLDFPHIYTTRKNIAYIRNNIKDAKILEKCRFFEILGNENESQKIAGITSGITKDSKYFCLQFNSQIFAYPYSGTEHISAKTFEPTYTFSFASTGEVMVNDQNFVAGDIITFDGKSVKNQKMKFTFDAFYVDANSIGVQAGYVLKDRELLSQGGVVLFTLQEDVNLKTIQGHIFIDSRGFVHRHEVMSIHKELVKAIRMSYEQIRSSEPDIERGQLVQKLKKEITKYAYVLTGRTPIVMPVIIDTKTRY
ncbi:hypothetical protein KGV55_02985 [Candidatus Gracilibacteria bacterium]|nr:hypothetical protein [Candidatus Gracilibacteria bacterium]